MRFSGTLSILLCIILTHSPVQAANIHDIEEPGNEIDRVDNSGTAFSRGQNCRNRNQSEQAFQWFLKAAELGHPESQLIIGECYTWGHGTPKSHDKAFYWLLKAAEQKQIPAYKLVASCYRYGTGTPINIQKADYWQRKSLQDKKEKIERQTGVQILDTISDEPLMKHYAAAVKGNPIDMDDVAWAFFEGKGVPQDKAQAIAWWTKAAKLGDAQSQYNLGKCYEYGEGTPRNKKEAQRWYAEADKPRNGQPSSYFRQITGNNNPTRGMTPEIKAIYDKAKAGDVEAELKLAFCYYDGDGVARNHDEARQWFALAAEHGNETARRLLPKFQPMRRTYWRVGRNTASRTSKINL